MRRPDDTSFTRGVNVTVVLDEDGGFGASARAAFTAQQRTYERVQRGQDVYRSMVPDPPGGSDLSERSIDPYIQIAGRTPKWLPHWTG